MSTAQIIQILITLIGIVLAVTVLLFGPFEMLGNGLLAFLIFLAAGTAASFAYAKLMKKG